MDPAVIDAARRGDRSAQARLLTALQDVWYRFSLSQLRDGERARDATQETGLRFLKQLGGFRGESRLETWSLGIALNVVREMRRERVSVGDAETDLEPRGGGLASSAEASVSLKEETDVLRRSLDILPERQREAIVLRFFEELSVEETAAAMNCAPGTVKATVHQALRALRARLTRTS